MAQRTCMVENCEEPHRAKGLCKGHYDAAWRRTHDRSEYQRTWAERHRDRRQAYHQAWRDANPDYGRHWLAERPGYSAENRRRYRTRLLAAPTVPFTPAELAAKLAYWSSCCWLCRSPWAEWDHVKPLAKGGSHMLANLRPICVPCNRRKSHTWPYPT